MNVHADEITTDAPYVLMETMTGRILKEHNSDTVVPMGTMNKIMTVLLTAEAVSSGNLKMDDMLTASSAANEAKGASIWLMPGEKMSVNDLLKGVIIGNANDACIVLAESIGGTTERFVDMMNMKAQEIGMKNTVFTSPCGVDDENQHTTACDIALAACRLTKYEFLNESMSTWMTYLREDKTELVNENRLVRTYKGISGIKAGNSEKSGFSVVASANRGNDKFVAAVMGCHDKDERFTVARDLLNLGFWSYKTIIPGFSTELMKPVKVKGGNDAAVDIEAYDLCPLVVPKWAEGQMEAVMLVPEYISAPVKKGQVIGNVAFYAGDTMIYDTPLIASTDVRKRDLFSCAKRIIVKMFK
ncbi:MAG: D-alanyl-D-alanine carboxypeptidase family protein [Oscillospiraceae bacterium]|nr:D-alanyl-D-alanine carboxypeptidase family protein [Oscillospiraceae bacterium]